MRKILVLILLIGTYAYAQERAPLFDSLDYRAELQLSLSSGEHTPLWLNANKYGLSSLEKTNGYLRGALERPLSCDNGRRWGVGYGLDVAVAGHYTSRLIVQQAYVEGRWLKGVLTIGSKEYPMELKNQELSTGAQTLGINARPVPQVRLALPDYWTIPGTKGWLAMKGHIAYGKTTDDNWQKSFTQGQHKYTEGTLYHSKAGYLKIGNAEKSLVSVELGVELACQFGGTSYVMNESGNMETIANEGGVKGMIHAFFPGGKETIEDDVVVNAAGNHVGSWLARVNFDAEDWGFSVYADHFFEDHSSMFFLDYDGYGEGDDWNTHVNNRYFLYALKDIQLGLDLRFNYSPWVNHIVMECFFSKYQSGPVFHDHDRSIPDHIAGIDNYYNHHIFTGWQHWGQVMGNPLYLSPIYNTNQMIDVMNNRSVAYHIGLSGDPISGLHYRLLGTYLKGYGTYWEPYSEPRKTVSLLAEATYTFPTASKMKGWSLKGALGMDHGKLLGNNFGLQLTIAKSGILQLKKK